MIYHVVPLDDWLRDPDRPYATPSLAAEGFVHCAPDEETALRVADAFYREAVGPLMVLLIEEERLDAPVRWEAAAPAPPPGCAPGLLFPHVYGRISRHAVVGMLEVERDAGGRALGLRVWS